MAAKPTERVRFLNNLSVAHRIVILILIPLAILLIMGAFALIALNQNRLALGDINNRFITVDVASEMFHRLQNDYIVLLHEVQIGNRTWDDGLETIRKLESEVREVMLPRLKDAKARDISGAGEQTLTTLAEVENLSSTLEKGKELLEGESRTRLELYLQNDLFPDIEPLRERLATEVQRDVERAKQALLVAQGNVKNFLTVSIALIVLCTLVASALGYFIYRSIGEPIRKLIGTMRRISEGDVQARVRLVGNNELTELGRNFDSMVEERIAIQTEIDREHKQLNQSVFSLLEAVTDLSERNLTIRARVTEDATGPLADAINQLAEDTTEVLKQVRGVATSVEAASQEVNRHTLSVNKLAREEQTEAEETSAQLKTILQRLETIAQSVQQANRTADTTSSATSGAQEAVSRVLDNMTTVRETALETGKRLKRLGERSQEISQIIDVIDNLSERTTVLALNANMQATAAGEAGRGFSMVAEEIQHLAGSSRESTEQIAILVRNIQQEANTTIGTMEQTIEKVVNGSALAEEAARQMQATQEATSELVASVEKIAKSSTEQVLISKALQTRAERILKATRTTGEELLSLTGLTKDMADYGKRLIRSVNVFKLEA